MLQSQMFRAFRKFVLTAAVFSLNSAALAQSDGPAILPVPPKPAEVDALGDVDAICFMAATEIASRAQQGAANLPPGQRESVVETSFRQIGYYGGRLSMRFGEQERAELLTTAAGRYANRTLNPDGGAILQWCFRSYLAGGNSVMDRFNEAIQLAPQSSGAPPAEIDPNSLDPDALCLVLVGMALPGTIDAARSNPGAANGAAMLGRAQHYFYGRVLAAPEQPALSQNLLDALRYGGQLEQANDSATALAKATACTDQFSAVWQALFAAAAAGVPNS